MRVRSLKEEFGSGSGSGRGGEEWILLLFLVRSGARD